MRGKPRQMQEKPTRRFQLGDLAIWRLLSVRRVFPMADWRSIPVPERMKALPQDALKHAG
jgi:hypothetical protein